MNAEGAVDDILFELDDLEEKKKIARKLEAGVGINDLSRGLAAGLYFWVLALVVALCTYLYIKLFGDGDYLNSPLMDYALYFGLVMGLIGFALMVFGNFIFDSTHTIPDYESLELDDLNALLLRKILNRIKVHVKEDSIVDLTLNEKGLRPVSFEGRVTNYEKLSFTFSGTLKNEVVLDISLVFRLKRVQERYALFKRAGRTLIQLPNLYTPKRHRHVFSGYRRSPWAPTSRYDFDQSSVVNLRLISKDFISREETAEISEKVVLEELQPAFPDCEFETDVRDNIVNISATFPTFSHSATPYTPDWDGHLDVDRVIRLVDIVANSRLINHN